MSRTRIADYAQFLLKTLLKRACCSRESRTNPSILAVCTIVVRSLRALNEPRSQGKNFSRSVSLVPRRRKVWRHTAIADTDYTLVKSYADVGVSFILPGRICPSTAAKGIPTNVEG